MPHHAFDIGKVCVGGSGLAGQHIFGVEDVETFVFHGPHVEITGGDDHEAVQIQAQAKAGFIPSHGSHQRVHRVFSFVQIARAHIHLQQVVFARTRGDALFATHQGSGN